MIKLNFQIERAVTVKHTLDFGDKNKGYISN